MFHASGWTYPWAITMAFATQVRPFRPTLSKTVLTRHKITLRNVSYPIIWNHLINSGVTHYCGAPTVQVRLSYYLPVHLDFPFDRSDW